MRTRTELGPELECGHYARPTERLRFDAEKWCDYCCCWRMEVEVKK